MMMNRALNSVQQPPIRRSSPQAATRRHRSYAVADRRNDDHRDRRPWGGVRHGIVRPHGHQGQAERFEVDTTLARHQKVHDLARLLDDHVEPKQVAEALAALSHVESPSQRLSSLSGTTYQIIATNSPMMAQRTLDLGLITDAGRSLCFVPTATRVSFFGSKSIEWSDGTLDAKAARVGLVSQLRLHDTWMQTKASHFHIDVNERRHPPEILDFGASGQPPAAFERVDVPYFDGTFLVSQWQGFVTIGKKMLEVTPTSLGSDLGHCGFLVGKWSISGQGWQGWAYGEPALGGDWLDLKIGMVHEQGGTYEAHAFIGEQDGQSICHKYFAQGATFFGRGPRHQAAHSCVWLGERKSPGQPTVVQRTSYLQRGDDDMQILGEVEQPDGSWAIVADLHARRS